MRIDEQVRPWRRTGVLWPAGRSLNTAAELHRGCGRELARLLTEMSSWPGAERGDSWLISDSTFLIVSFGNPRTVEPYAQFLSEPTESTVLCEVCSSQYLPRLKGFLTPSKERALAARGFGLGKPPSNFRRTVTVNGAGTARRLANETLDILFEIFEYRGTEELQFTLQADRRAVRSFLHFKLTSDQLAALLKGWGFQVAEVGKRSSTRSAVLRTNRGACFFDSVLAGPEKRGSYFRALTLVCFFVPNLEVKLASVNSWNALGNFSRAILHADGSVRLAIRVPLFMGVTEDALFSFIDTFTDEIRQFAAVAPALPRTRKRETVH